MTTSTLTAADYSEWIQYAGLYLFNVSHTDRYKTFQQKISDAGLSTKIVFDFLKDNKGGINLRAWRNGNVYEQPADAKWRLEQTAKSLEAIGAPRIADRMRTLKDTSLGGALSGMILGADADDPKTLMEKMKDIDPAKLMEEFRANVARAVPDMAAAAGMPTPPKPTADMDIESWEQIEHLLDRYVKSHESDLRGDMARHGDPRAEPGFDPEKRMAELERLRRAEYDREAQRDDVPKMTVLMEEIENLIAKNTKIKPGKVAKPRRELLEHFRKYADRPLNELLPDMQKCIEKTRRFQEKHIALFRPKPIDDERLLQRLAAFGEYDVDMGSKKVRLSWDAPAGLASDWTSFSLSLDYPIGDAKTLTAVLDACERMRKNFAKHQAELREQVLESFEMYREHLERIGLLDDYERDDEGNPTLESIFKNAGGGSIHVEIPEWDEESTSVAIQVWFRVEWDEEHGLELSIIDEPEVEPEPQAAALTKVRFSDSGPKLTAEDIAAFEAERDLKLPAEYRNFLLAHNGGRPEPNHLKVSMQGHAAPIYVDELYALHSEGSVEDLGEAIDIHLANDFPAEFIPIGRARVSNPGAESGSCALLIGLSGRKKDKVLLAISMEHMMFGAPAEMFESCVFQAAPCMSVFLARLTLPPHRG